MKYIKALFIYIISVIVQVSFLIFFYIATPSVFPEDFVLWIFLNATFFALGTIIGAVVLGYFLTPLFLFSHKRIMGKNKSYGIQEHPKPQKFDIFQSLFPVLLSLNLSIMLLSNEIILRFVTGRKFDLSSLDLTTFNELMLIFAFFTLITVVVSFASFSPAWFLLDAGVVYSNKEIENRKGRPGECRTVGGWYIDLLKGYAGIGVILSYVQLYMLFMTVGASVLAIILVLIYYSLIPIFMVGGSVIALIILDTLREHRVKYIRKWTEKLGITDKVEIVFKGS